MALRVDGRNDGNITGSRYLNLGVYLGLTERAARRAVRETAEAVHGWITELPELPFDAGVVKKLERVIRRRQGLLLDA